MDTIGGLISVQSALRSLMKGEIDAESYLSSSSEAVFQ